MPAPRIVSLVPSGTDMVAELGLGEGLVGVSHQCDHPIGRGKPVVTSSTLPSVGPSVGPSAGASGAPVTSPAEVDGAVSRAVQAGEPLYRTDLSLLTRLRPDVVVAQDVCDVCAVGGDDVRDGLPAGAELVTLEATAVPGLEDDLLRLGKATAAEDRASAAFVKVCDAIEVVADQVKSEPRRQALVLEWGDPPFLGGHWVPELVERAGGRHLLSEAGQASRRAAWDEIVAARPDVVVFSPCGYTLAAARAEAGAIRGRLDPATELWATHATGLFSRCTPAAVLGGVRLLAGILHPDVAPPPQGHLAARIYSSSSSESRLNSQGSVRSK